MKVTVSIYNNSGLVAQKTVNSLKKASEFESKNIPLLTMQDKVKQGYKVLRNYN